MRAAWAVLGLAAAASASAQQVSQADVESCVRQSGSIAVIAACVEARVNQGVRSCEDRVGAALRAVPKPAAPDPKQFCAAAVAETSAEERERARRERDKAVADALASAGQNQDEAAKRREAAAVKAAVDQVKREYEAALPREREKAVADAAARRNARRAGASDKMQAMLAALGEEVVAEQGVVRSSFDPVSGVLIVEQKDAWTYAIPFAALQSVSTYTDPNGRFYVAFLCADKAQCSHAIQRDVAIKRYEYPAALRTSTKAGAERVAALAKAVLDVYAER